jgi:fructokinase
MALRLGVDLGGTKIEIAVFESDGREMLRRRAPTPRAGYDAALEEFSSLILDAERAAGAACNVGVGMPGTIHPRSGRVINAYNTPFNGRRLKHDLEERLEREVRFANDANCFALSEALDGAGAGCGVLFGAILGTGVGGGIVVSGAVLNGHHGIGGEWGHTPLPWMTREEYPGPMCNCGRPGCIEQWCSGPALAREKGARGEDQALAVYADRLARALSLVINFLDPEIIVLGGGVSREQRLYASVPQLLPRYVYSPIVRDTDRAREVRRCERRARRRHALARVANKGVKQLPGVRARFVAAIQKFGDVHVHEPRPCGESRSGGDLNPPAGKVNLAGFYAGPMSSRVAAEAADEVLHRRELNRCCAQFSAGTGPSLAAGASLSHVNYIALLTI